MNSMNAKRTLKRPYLFSRIHPTFFDLAKGFIPSHTLEYTDQNIDWMLAGRHSKIEHLRASWASSTQHPAPSFPVPSQTTLFFISWWVKYSVNFLHHHQKKFHE